MGLSFSQNTDPVMYDGTVFTWYPAAVVGSPEYHLRPSEPPYEEHKAAAATRRLLPPSALRSRRELRQNAIYCKINNAKAIIGVVVVVR